MQNPIGMTFIPNQENQEMGPRRGQLEGSTEQAIKILSLQLPRILGARAISPQVGGPGAAGGPRGFNPHSAVFEALLRAMGQRGGFGPAGPSGPMGGIPAPNVTPGQLAPAPSPEPIPTTNPVSRTPRNRTPYF